MGDKTSLENLFEGICDEYKVPFIKSGNSSDYHLFGEANNIIASYQKEENRNDNICSQILSFQKLTKMVVSEVSECNSKDNRYLFQIQFPVKDFDSELNKIDADKNDISSVIHSMIKQRKPIFGNNLNSYICVRTYLNTELDGIKHFIENQLK